TAPVLTVPGNQTINELTTLTVTNTATDADSPANALTFALVSAPSGMSLNTNSGVITWTPTEVQGPSTNTVTVSVTDNGSPNFSNTNSFTVIVNQVNNAPIFTLTTNVLNILEDAGPQSLTIASLIDVGAPDEGSQSLTITVTNNNTGLFSHQPTITNGVLDYCVASNANGSVTVTITVTDDGGTLNGGVNTTTTNLMINVSPVNDAPSFTKGSDVSLAPVNRSVAVTNWATNIRRGPTNESAQGVIFIVTNDSSSSFVQQPTISSNGILRFEIAAAVSNILATISVQLTDDGGTTNGGIDTSSVQTFRISLSGLFGPSTNYAAGQGPAGIWLGNLRGLTFAGATKSGGPRYRDMIVANYLANSVTIRFCNDDGTFTSATNYPVGLNPFGVISGDFDRDGFEDIVTANSGTNTVSILMNQINRTFAPATDYVVGSTSNPGPMGVVPADFDGDGRLDLAIANYNESTVTVLKGLGNGVFSSPTNYAVGQGPMMVWFGDCDKDGKIDLITPNKDAGTLTILPGLGNGTFGTAQTVTLFSGGNPQPTYVMPSDFNGDGRLDLVTANYNSNTVSILIGQSNGTFVVATNYSVGNNPRSVLVRDLNHDGLVDLAVANSGSDSVSILLSEGGGAFHSTGHVPVGGTPMIVVGSNFNNDDATDIAVTDYADNGVTIFIYSAPLAYNFGFTLYEDTPTTIPLRSSMSGGALLSYTVTSQPSHGVVTNVGTNIVYTSDTNYFGSDSFTYTARYDSNGVVIVSAVATVSLTVAPVNDAPSFSLPVTELVLVGNAVQQTNLNFATGMSAGPNESAQTLSFVLSTTNAAFFSVQPQISPTGTLTFRTATGALGTNTVTVRLADNGGVTKGTNQSSPQTFKIILTNVPPVITLQPSIVSAIQGNNATFQTTATGTPPFNYQWAVNGAPIASATDRVLSLTNVQSVGTNFYDCTVSNAGGLVTTVTNALHGRLICIADTNKPIVAITYPIANVRFTNQASYTFGGVTRVAPSSVISGTATDSGLITNVTITRIFPAYPLVEMHPTLYGLPGAKKWTNEVTLVGGTNVWKAVVQDSAGNSNSVLITRSCFFAASATLSIVTNGAGSITPVGTAASFAAFGTPIDGASLEAGRQYTILATPAGNNIFTNWTVMDDLTTNCFSTNKLTFTMVTNLVITGNFVTNPIVAGGVAGKYNGLFYETNGVGEPNIKTNSTGFVGNLIVGTNRTYSGALTLEGKVYAIAGTFDVSGDATKVVPRAIYSRSNLFVSLHLDWAQNTKTVTGVVSNMSNIGDDQWSAPLLADLAGTASTLGTSSRYTMLIAPGSDSPTNSPGGYGYGLVTNNPLGLITLSGKLSDGTAIAQTVPKSKDGYWPLFVSLYGGRELVAGWQSLAGGVPTGTLGWVKETMSSSSLIKSYLDGFTNASVDVSGSTYVKPALNTPALANTNLVLEINSLDTNDVTDLKWDVQLKPNNTFVVKPGTVGNTSATNLLTGSITVADGTLSFTFRPTGFAVNRIVVGAVNQSQTNGFGANIGRSRVNPSVTNVSSFYLHTP
ncbi:MAG: Alkaline phosphatase, partial [Verrucomicrobiales bacterium]|nr:Alkaline phosphatase [Verrucomicrobiales bacterium]